jgi:hypothetical protein
VGLVAFAILGMVAIGMKVADLLLFEIEQRRLPQHLKPNSY